MTLYYFRHEHENCFLATEKPKRLPDGKIQGMTTGFIKISKHDDFPIIEKNQIVKLVSNDGKCPICQVLTHGEDEDD